MHPKKPVVPGQQFQPKGFFLKKFGEKQERVEKESMKHDQIAPFLLPPAAEAQPTAEDKLTGLQKLLLRTAKTASDLAMVEAVATFLGRIPSDQELAARGVFITANEPDANGLEVCEFRFDLQPLFIRRIGFVGNEFRISFELLQHPIV